MDKKDDLLKNKIWKLFLLLLFICNVVIRFYKLGTNIPNAYVDEAAIGYSSWCLANYGIDRYLNSFPIYIKNFYGGSSAAYSYLLIPIIKIFGLNLFSERFLNAFAYAVVFPVIYLILKRVLKSRLSIALTLLVYTFSPFIIILSRTGLDCNLLFPTIVIAFYESNGNRADEMVCSCSRSLWLFLVYIRISVYYCASVPYINFHLHGTQ